MKREARQNYYRQMHTAAREIYEAGQADERDRIIKLLENSLIAVDWEGIFWNEETMGKSFSVDVQDIIALIKGEK
jgi:hypothetical protein